MIWRIYMLNKMSNVILLDRDGFLMRLFLVFLIYAICGWIIEVIAFKVENHKLVNRGFLFGTYCPITGIGCILCIFLLNKFKSYPLVVFLLGMILTSGLEYLTSYIMEKVFHARWWDYSKAKFNINGRVKLINSIAFGIGSLILIYLIDPFIVNMINSLPYNVLSIIFGILFITFNIDIIVSIIVIRKTKIKHTHSIKDDTEEIKKNTTKYIKEKLIFKQS